MATLRGRIMKTAFLLMAQYDGLAVIPVEWVCRDYFRHLSSEKFLRKVLDGEISIPIVRMEGSQKCAKGVPTSTIWRPISTGRPTWRGRNVIN